jgi:transcriptional regulator with XRE-family HTH domain
MRTTRSAISRLESGLGHRPRLTTLESYALVVGCRVEIVIRRGP